MILYKYIQCIYQLLSYTADFQSLSCSLLVILYYIRPICYAVSGWVFTSSCYSFVICLYFYNTSQGHSVDLQLFFIFFAITVPDNIWFIQHFYIFFIINFCIFYHVKKISIYYLRNQRWRRFCWWCWWYAFVVIDRFELWYIHVNIPYLLLSGLTYWFTTVNQ